MATSIPNDIHEAVLLDCGDENGDIFTTTFLNKIFKKSIRRLNQTLGLSSTSRPIGIAGYKSLNISPITYDLTAGTISPDNDEIADMIILQMEYVIKKGEISALKRLNAGLGGTFATSVGSAVNDDIRVQNADNTSISIGGNRLSNRSRLFTLDLETIKEELEEAKKRFISRMVGNYSKMVY